MRHCSDKRLARLVRDALYALEDPAAGFVFDDFDLRYLERERRRERKSAEWFYHDKVSFETKYGEECAEGREPAWVSDGGSGTRALHTIVSFDLDGMRDAPFWLRLWRRKRLALSPKQRAVLDALAVDWRSRPAARIAGVDHKTADACKKIFKVHFAQCHQAWKRDFAF